MSELKPCPFCGRADHLASIPWHNGARVGYLVGCIFLNCVRPHVYGDNEIVAIRTWNSRPIEDALARRLAAAEKVVEAVREYRDAREHRRRASA